MFCLLLYLYCLASLEWNRHEVKTSWVNDFFLHLKIHHAPHGLQNTRTPRNPSLNPPHFSYSVLTIALTLQLLSCLSAFAPASPTTGNAVLFDLLILRVTVLLKLMGRSPLSHFPCHSHSLSNMKVEPTSVCYVVFQLPRDVPEGNQYHSTKSAQ